ncbi:flavin-containing monooxygenase [Bacillus sonorensis]|uniref:flavin-containing monooxygenase n=1 Tax=Bacillus sonorensis TaxID=119858 RepID=UPI002280E1E3|nr:NAD(P)/FAD-dependent oxidoreductase [Bacillus sonorensis]MCY8034297.1 NAD(P)/FAD-dependent oxidoreductase [Bacillus sonorensis]MCY8565352.1 NAD(P)/FAD-dependent oxidoreductase [Bacillus sonorensis]
MKQYDVVIVGSGQAGLAMANYLRNESLRFTLLDSSERVGDSWRRRYDSLVLFTPRKYSSLPGLQMEGPPEGFPTKDEIADYFENYSRYFDLPVQLKTHVITLKKKHDTFEIETNHGIIIANQVVVATGAFQRPLIPSVIDKKDEKLFQIHSSLYRSPKQVPEGSVLVVGGGNSGAQIAAELAHERNVTLATSHPFKFLPLRFLGKSIFFWLDITGLLYAGVDTKKGRWFRKQNDPIFGKELKTLIVNRKINVKPKVVSVKGNEILFEDHSKDSFNNIIWSTGFFPSYEWIDIEGVTSSNGRPIHNRGISPIKGLYFIGLPWQYQRGSALICGVGRDAKYLISFISKMRDEERILN